MEYILFSLPTLESLQRITSLFTFIADKKNEKIQIPDLEYLILEQKDNFFTEFEFSQFWWPSEEESRLFWQHYQKLSKKEQLQYLVPWDFESAFSEIGQGEYRIKGIVKCNLSSYKLYIEPIAFPFGGLEPLKGVLTVYGALIEEDSFQYYP